MAKIDLFLPNTNRVAGVAHVDKRDVSRISKGIKYSRWYLNSSGYAYGIDAKTGNKVFMHRRVAEISRKQIKGLQVDHIDRDRLNNRSRNLRVCTAEQNRLNRRLKSEIDPRTGLIGVETVRKAEKVDGVLRIMDVHVVDGEVYEHPLQAVRAANKSMRKEKGKFAYQNPLPRIRKSRELKKQQQKADGTYFKSFLFANPEWEEKAVELLRRKGCKI